MGQGYRQADPRGLRGRVRREYSSPGGEVEDEWFVDVLIGTINIGASLEDATWDLALSIFRKPGGIDVRSSWPRLPGLLAHCRQQSADTDGSWET